MQGKIAIRGIRGRAPKSPAGFVLGSNPKTGNIELQPRAAFVDAAGATAAVMNSGVIPAPANPSATAGPSAVNGSATTFMRSDGAPAIQVGSSSQKGLLQVDGTTITAVSGIVSSLAQRHLYAPCVVSSLPAGAQGDHGLVTDATVSLALGLGLAPTGGGTNKAPVYFDGSSWLIG